MVVACFGVATLSTNSTAKFSERAHHVVSPYVQGLYTPVLARMFWYNFGVEGKKFKTDFWERTTLG